MHLIYDDLVRDYLDSLHSKLRNFNVEPEFLATWVHDEDDDTSIKEIFAAAREAGCRQLTLGISATVAAGLKQEAFAAPFRVEVLPGGGWNLHAELSEAPTVVWSGPSSPRPQPSFRPTTEQVSRPQGIHPAYRSALARLSAAPLHEGRIPHQAAAADGEARLLIAVDPQGIVTAAHHLGAVDEMRGLLEGLCGVLEGRSFQEGHDHGMIRLEAILRDRSVPSPVRGVLTPRNADPVFARPQKMLKDAYRAWGVRAGWNFWDDSPGAAWLSLPDRLARTQEVLTAGCASLGIPKVEVLEILQDCRIVLASAPVAPHLIRLESLVKQQLDPRLEIQLESLEDRNRRAARTQRG